MKIDSKDISVIIQINIDKIEGLSKEFENWLDEEESREFREEACEDTGETLIIFLNSVCSFLQYSDCEHRETLEKLVEVCKFYKITQIIKLR